MPAAAAHPPPSSHPIIPCNPCFLARSALEFSHQPAAQSCWLIPDKSAKAEGQDGKQAADGVAARLGWPSVAAWLAHLRAALAKGDLAGLDQQRDLWYADSKRQILADVAEEDRRKTAVYVGKRLVHADAIVGPGPGTCPEDAVLAMLADLADTHPPTDARIARIQQLAVQLHMLQRATTPPVELGGQFYAGSMARGRRLACRRALHSRQCAMRSSRHSGSPAVGTAAVQAGGATGGVPAGLDHPEA